MSAVMYHYDGSPCFESCPCASREVERLRAQLEAVTRERDEARAKAEKGSSYAQNAVDKICHYRNLAIILGAKPEQMLGKSDRDLCIDGIDKDDTNGGYHMSVQDVLDDNAETWGAHDKMERERDAARESEARMRAALVGLLRRVDDGSDYSPEHAVSVARAALSAPAPEPSERMMRVAEAVQEACALEAWNNEPDGVIAALIRALDRRAIVAKVAP